MGQAACQVLFLSHSGGRSGAPQLLLHFQRWLRRRGGYEFATVLRSGGALVPEYAKLGPTFVTPADRAPESRSLVGRIRRWLGPVGRGNPGSDWLKPVQAMPVRIIYSNTATNGALLARLVRPGMPVITHVHELEYWIQRCGPENWAQTVKATTRYIAASEATARNLRDRRGIPAERIDVVHEFVPTESVPVPPEASAAVRTALGIPTGAFVVCGSGVESWRKGRDLFVQLAARVRRTAGDLPIFFVWVGPAADRETEYWLRYDAERAGVADRLHWTGETGDPSRYFAAADVFVMVSREDPFPLVCLEAAAMGRPVLCFEGSGGTSELVESDAGYVVPYLDLALMAHRVVELSQDKPLRQRLGQVAAEKVRQRFSVGVCAPRLLEVVERELIGSAGPASS